MGHGSKRRECILRVRERKRSGGEEEEEEMEAEEAGMGRKRIRKRRFHYLGERGKELQNLKAASAM